MERVSSSKNNTDKNLPVPSKNIFFISKTMIIVFNHRLTMKPKEPSDCHFIDLNEVFLSLECSQVFC